jgi:hypothetical protein
MNGRISTFDTALAGAFGYLLGGASSASPLPKKILLPNTAYITNTYDPVARLTGTYLKNSGNTTLDSYAYVCDPANERTNLTRADNSTVAFNYDNIGQLKIATSSVSTEDRGYLYVFRPFLSSYFVPNWGRRGLRVLTEVPSYFATALPCSGRIATTGLDRART